LWTPNGTAEEVFEFLNSLEQQLKRANLVEIQKESTL
jgi:hypothetical protein